MLEASLWHQTVTLVKRNILLKYRRKSQTIQELLFPLYFIGILILLKLLAFKPQNYPAIPLSDTVTTYVFPSANVSLPGLIYVAPNFTEAITLMESVKNLSSQSLSYTMFNSLEEMDSSYKSAENRDAFIGIYFPSSSIYEYALRYKYNSISTSDFDYAPGSCRAAGDGTDRSMCQANRYLYSGFAALQTLIDSAVVGMNGATFPITNVSVQVMPKDPSVSNTDAFGIITPIYFVLAFSPLLTFLLVNIVYEKEKKIKEGMKMMGLNDLAFWFSWSTVYVVLIFCLSIVTTIMSVFGQLFPRSNFFLIFLCTFLYGISLVMLAYLITPFFSKARTAASVGSFLTLFMSLVFLAVNYSTFSNAGVAAVSLLSPTAFAFVISKVVQFEVRGDGAQFSNITEDPNPLYIGLVMIAVDIVLYFLLTLYFDRVIPSEYGKKDSPFFCLKPSFWFKSKKKKQLGRSTSIRSSHSHTAYETLQYIEPVPQELIGQEAIRLQNLTKIYRKDVLCSDSVVETAAVKNFSLDIYKGQITALLGHNGAGKTTIFNILTGFVSLTEGSAHVYDYDISDPHDLDEIRKITGVCPQHDILHDVLSVKEHLEVFAGIKGIKGDARDVEVDRVLNAIGLMDQKETYAEKLSGGQKRKLSVGIAIMGDPKILILDEPTAGVDPYSRRKMWDLLQSGRENRITVLTTHFMDEADILADRKAIIGKGKLKCVGSSLFLKNRFGVGYHLGLVTKSNAEQEKITDCIARHVEDAKLQRSIGMELTYTLPLARVSNFANLFSALDEQQNELGLQSYGVSMTSLEEVFLKIGDEDEEEESEEPDVVNGKDVSIGYDNPSSPAEDEGCVSITVNNNRPMFDPSVSEGTSERNNPALMSALIKRVLYVFFRSPGYVFFTMLFPLGLVIGAVAVLGTANTSDPNSGNPLAINVFSETYTHQNILYKNSTGQDLTDFTRNIPSGLTASENDFNDLLKPGFYPHYIGLDVMDFSSSRANYKALYNTSAVKSIPAAINTFSNTMLSFLTRGSKNITTFNKPWPLIDQQATFNGSIFGGVLMAALAIVMTCGLTILFPVLERELKIRPQLRVSGVSFFQYWFSLLVPDYTIYFLVCSAFVICLAAFQISFFYTSGAMIALILLLIGWGFASIFASYCCNFLFSKMDMAATAWPLVVQLASMLPYITVSTLDMLGSTDLAQWLNVVFVIFIPYYVGFSGIYYISKLYITALFQGQQNNIPIAAYFDWSNPMIPFAILVAYVQGIFFFFLLMVLDIKVNGGEFPLSFLIKKKSDVSDSSIDLSNNFNQDNIEGEDDDVAQERRKVDQIMNNELLTEESPVVLMQGLRKEFEKRTGKCCSGCRELDEDETDIKVAVRNMSLTAYSGEVLGLLGPNGAGKTTALNVLIADTAPTKGKISMAGKSVLNTMSDAFKDTGYCPQNNPLWDQISLREHLEIYATVRGVKKESIPPIIDNFIEALGVTEHANKRAKTLSGGTKRKLCFAMSMLANPKVVLMDEPSTGMDPKTKRFMWDTISTAFQGSSRGAILTTHYMEEADALCSRVAIMVLGQLKCIGSTQHLKNKFGQGYIIEIKLENQETDDDASSTRLSSFVKELFPNSEPAEKFGNRSVFKIPKQDVTSLANVFSTLEGSKSDLGIEEYSFSQSTLEQVFLQFAKEQEKKDEEQQERIQDRARLRKEQKKSCW